ncbi:hypothetical protein VNI00_009820 [Paramarasmius palmivorus]|uniref:Uncharacterized protein n=1 Tax=Paramarasmius palmivorus TaxID=297713 RepID=A0AAW0CP65_9AGAR
MPGPIPAAQLYRERLYTLRHGHGLWIPEPSRGGLPPECTDEGIRIGDVGFFTDSGGFIRIFNVCESEGYPLNRHNGVPPGFKPMKWNRHNVEEVKNLFVKGTPVHSVGIDRWGVDVSATLKPPCVEVGAGMGFSVSFAEAKGAVLVPRTGASQMNCLERARFMDYAKENGASWYKFINGDQGWGLVNGSLHLVTGVDQSSAWEVVVVDGKAADRSCSLEFNTGGIANGHVKLCRSSFQSTSVMSRCSLDDENEQKNQTLFVRGICVSVQRPRFLRKGTTVKVSDSSSGVHPDVGSRSVPRWVPYSDIGTRSEESRMASGEGSPGGPIHEAILLEDNMAEQVSHPLMAVNEALLEACEDAEIAVTHDDDWITVLDEQDSYMPDNQTLIERVLKTWQIGLQIGEFGGKFCHFHVQVIPLITDAAAVFLKHPSPSHFEENIVPAVQSRMPEVSIESATVSSTERSRGDLGSELLWGIIKQNQFISGARATPESSIVVE